MDAASPIIQLATPGLESPEATQQATVPMGLRESLPGAAGKLTAHLKKDTRKRLAPGDFPGGSEVKESACNARDLGLIPGLERSPGEGNGNPLQYSCWENSMDRGA